MEKGKLVAGIGLLLIMILVVVIAFYYISSQNVEEENSQNNEPPLDEIINEIEEKQEDLTMSLELIDTFCFSGSVTFVLRNTGINDIEESSIIIESLDEDCDTDPVVKAIPAGKTEHFEASGCNFGREHSYLIKGPANELEISVYCV